MELKQFEPYWRWVIVEPIIPEKSSGGLYLPQQDIRQAEPAQTAKVLKVGREVQRVAVDQVVVLEDVSRAKLMTFDDCKGRLIYAVQEMVVMGGVPPQIEDADDSIRTSPSD